MDTNEALATTEDFDIIDPREAARLAKASEILTRHIAHGETIEQACQSVGISCSTYARWVKDGIFAPLIQAYLAPVVMQLQSNALTAMKDGVAWMMDVVKGTKGTTATNFDRMAAIRFLWKELAQPLLSAAPVPDPKPEEVEDPAEKFLEKTPAWLGPGEKLTHEKKLTESVERHAAGEVIEGEARDLGESEETPLLNMYPIDISESQEASEGVEL